MYDIEDILLKYNVTPTLLTASQKQMLSRLLSAPNSAEIEEFLERTQSDLHALSAQLQNLADGMLHLLDEVSRVMDNALGSAENAVSISDASSIAELNELHVRILSQTNIYYERIAQTAAKFINLQTMAKKSILSPDFLSLAIIFHIVLQEIDGAPSKVFKKILDEKESPQVQTSKLLQQFGNLLTTVNDVLSRFITQAAQTVAEIGRGKQAQAKYFALLRTEQQILHQLKEETNRIKKEAQYVQISDVL